MKRLYIHGHIVPDGNLEFLDGALLIEDGKVLDVFPQTSRVEIEEDTEVIDLEGKILLPAFFDPLLPNKEEEGVSAAVVQLKKEEEIKPGSYEVLGTHIEKGVPLREDCLSVSSDHEEAAEAYAKGIKVLVKAGAPVMEYDGFAPVLLEDVLDKEGDSVSALALEGKDYTEVNDEVSSRTLGILLKLIGRHKLIFCGGRIPELVLKARALHVRWCDIVSYTSLNAFELYGLSARYGGLKRGKKADFLVLDEEGNILETPKEGRP